MHNTGHAGLQSARRGRLAPALQLLASLLQPLAGDGHYAHLLHTAAASVTHQPTASGSLASTQAEPPKWYNTTYSYPDGAGALIVEGPFPYKNGPSVFSDSNLLGAYGMIIIPGTVDKEDPEAGCTPVPAESPFASSSSVYPVKMTNGVNDCLLGCNWTEVEATGIDPCNAGSLPKGAGLSNSVMSCFNLGPGTEGHGGGACGYNCTSLKNTTSGQLVGCTRAHSSECNVYCDTRTFPGRG